MMPIWKQQPKIGRRDDKKRLDKQKREGKKKKTKTGQSINIRVWLRNLFALVRQLLLSRWRVGPEHRVPASLWQKYTEIWQESGRATVGRHRGRSAKDTGREWEWTREESGSGRKIWENKVTAVGEKSDDGSEWRWRRQVSAQMVSLSSCKQAPPPSELRKSSTARQPVSSWRSSRRRRRLAANLLRRQQQQEHRSLFVSRTRRSDL